MSDTAGHFLEWSSYFETGLESIDDQHHRLVELINLLGNRVASTQGASVQTVERVLDGFSRYVSFHFAGEETLMCEARVDPRHAVPHCKAHAAFLVEIERMRIAALSDDARSAPLLLRFIASWLSVHILDADQAMTRQIRAIGSGVEPAEAFVLHAVPSDPGTAAVLDAVGVLLDAVTERNAASVAVEREGQTCVATPGLVGHAVSKAGKLDAFGHFAVCLADGLDAPLARAASRLEALRGCAEKLLASDSAQADSGHDAVRNEFVSALGEIGKEVEGLTGIASAMCDMAGLEVPPTEPGRLENVLQAAVSASACARAPGLVVSCNWDTLPPVRLSRSRLQRAFQALLDNAARAVGARGAIRVLAGREREEVWVDIIDNGCGMTDDVQHRIFEPFFTTRSAEGGRGLGLTMARQVVLAHGGRIEVKSALNQGSRFRVVLPRIAATENVAAPDLPKSEKARSGDRAVGRLGPGS